MKYALSSRRYLSLAIAIGVFTYSSLGGYVHRNIIGVALPKVAAILIATAPFEGGDAPENQQEERA